MGRVARVIVLSIENSNADPEKKEPIKTSLDQGRLNRGNTLLMNSEFQRRRL